MTRRPDAPHSCGPRTGQGQQFPSTETVNRFLCLLLRGRWDAAALQAARAQSSWESLDWDTLVQVARVEGLTPLLYSIVRDQNLAPPPVEQALRLAYYYTAHRNSVLFHELETVLHCLAAKGVPVLLLKGAALAEAVYGNIAVRPMTDLDLLVRQEHVPIALRTLSVLGYEHLHPRPQLCAGYIVAYEDQMMLVKPGGNGHLIEIHWRLFSRFYYQSTAPLEWFWQTALPVRIGDVLAWMLGPEARVLYLCGHVLQHHLKKETRLIWLHDVAEVIAHYQERIDWDQVLARAQAYGFVLPVQQVLIQVNEGWHAPISPAVLERLHALCPSPEEERTFARFSSPHRALQVHRARLAHMPGWRARLRFVWCNLFPSADYMQDRYRISHRFLVPLYYAYRLLKGLRWAMTQIAR